MTRDTAERGEIIRVLVGSTTHGLALEGKDDRDEMGVTIEAVREGMGLFAVGPVAHFIYRSAAEREGKNDAPSQPGDLDLTIYTLRKFLHLALGGNPSVLNLLFVPRAQWLKGDDRGAELQAQTPYIVSREAGKKYLGYLQAQKERLLGLRGQMGVRRQRLVEEHGYDTKYAMHMLRLGVQGVELLRTGRVSLPVPEPERGRIRAVREGKVPLSEVLDQVGHLEGELKDLLSTSPLAETPDRRRVETWMIKTYQEVWSKEPL